MTPTTVRPIFMIGEVARLLNVTAEAIRKAEREHRVPMARRDVLGDRYYYAEDIAILRAYFA